MAAHRASARPRRHLAGRRVARRTVLRQGRRGLDERPIELPAAERGVDAGAGASGRFPRRGRHPGARRVRCRPRSRRASARRRSDDRRPDRGSDGRPGGLTGDPLRRRRGGAGGGLDRLRRRGDRHRGRGPRAGRRRCARRRQSVGHRACGLHRRPRHGLHRDRRAPAAGRPRRGVRHPRHRLPIAASFRSSCC